MYLSYFIFILFIYHIFYHVSNVIAIRRTKPECLHERANLLYYFIPFNNIFYLIHLN